MKPKTIIFVGPQGSGKGTQVEQLMATLLAAGEKVVNIQTGRLFRALAETDSFTSRRVKELIEAGTLVPDFLTHALWVNDLIKQMDESSHLLIDGFPRNVEQAKVVDEALAFFKRDNIEVVNLDTPESVVVERMLARGRSDDTPDSIKHRLEQFKAETIPVLDYYREQDAVSVHDIAGDMTIDEVQQAIKAALSV